MSEDRDRLVIERLDSTNWPTWKVLVRNYLKARRLWKLCTGDLAAPVRGQAETDADFLAREEDYEVNCAKVLSTLGQAISTQYLYLVTAQSVVSPKDAWDALLEHFEHPSLSNKLALTCQLFGFQMKSGSTMQAHLKELSDLVERLAALGSPVDEQYQVALLLQSLPTAYEPLRAAYMAKGAVQMSELHEALITQEARFVEQDGGSEMDSGERALFGRSSGNCRYTGCYRCGSMDHCLRYCPKRGESSSRGASRGKRNQHRNRRDDAAEAGHFSGFAKMCEGEEEYHVF